MGVREAGRNTSGKLRNGEKRPVYDTDGKRIDLEKSWGKSKENHFVCSKDTGFPGGTTGKEPACQCRRHKRCRFDPWVGKILWRRAWQPTPIFLPGEPYGQRSLVGYSPWGCRVVYKLNDLACMHAGYRRHRGRHGKREEYCSKFDVFIISWIPNDILWASLVAQMVKNLPAMWETWVWSLGQKDSLEKGMATHSSILAWKIPWTEESGRLWSMGSQRVRQDLATNTFDILWNCF